MNILEFVRNQFRTLAHFKLATSLNLIGLSVAFAAFIIIMIQWYTEYTFNRAIPESDKIFRLETSQNGVWSAEAPYPLMDLFAKSSPHIKEYGLNFGSYESTLSLEKHTFATFRERQQSISPGFLKIMGIKLIEGNGTVIGSDNVEGFAVISDGLAKKIFGNEQVVGRSFYFGGYNYGGDDGYSNSARVLAVYKKYPANTFISNEVIYELVSHEDVLNWKFNQSVLYVKLDDPAHAKKVVDEFMRIFKKDQFGWENIDVSFRLTPLNDLYYTTGVQNEDCTQKGNKTTSLILFSIAWLILFIASINFMNFSIALAPVRIKSVNTQKIMGESILSLRLSFICEAVLLSLISFIMALLIIQLITRTSLNTLFLADIQLQNNLFILLFAAGIAVLLGVVAAIYPALYMTSFSPAWVLSGSFKLTPLGRNFRVLLMTFQYSISIALICMSLFIHMQNRYLLQVPLGFDSSQLLTVETFFSQQGNLYTCVEKLKQGASIVDVTGAGSLLLNSEDRYGVTESSFGTDIFRYHSIMCMPNFFEVMGIKPTEGTSFSDPLIDQSFGIHYVFSEKAKKDFNLKLGDIIPAKKGWWGEGDIIGFFPDIRYLSSRQDQEVLAFSNGPRNRANRILYIRLAPGVNLTEAIRFVKKTVADAELNVRFEVRLFDQILEQLYQKELKIGTIITLFSLIVVLISIAGVFGLVLFESRARRKEIGIRKINGATISEIIVLFNKTYLVILGISSAIAIPVAWIGARYWLEQFKDRISVPWWVFVIAILLVSLITALTVTLQCWRTATANPIESIKNE